MPTEHAAVSDTAPLVPGFLDRLGDRVQLTDRESGHVEVLRLRPELTASSLFEPAVRRRAEQLVGFIHPNFARVRQIGRLPAPDGRLAIMSDAVDGWRLSEVLEAVGPCRVAFHPDAVLFLLNQLLGAVADLHQVALGVSHGALGTDRLVLTADGRLVVTESVLGAALRHLPLMPPDRLWRDLRLAVAASEAQPFGRLTDLRQIGIVAVSLALGRQLRRDENPTRLGGVLKEWPAAQSGAGAEALGPAFRDWLLRVLSLADDLASWSVADARRELNHLVESDRRYALAPTGLPALLSTVADYYAAPADVRVPVVNPPAHPVVNPPAHPDVSAPAHPVVSAPAHPDVKPPAPGIPAAAHAAPQPALIETHSAAMLAGPPASSIAASHGPAAVVGPLTSSIAASHGPAAVVGPLADTIVAESPDAPGDQRGGRWREPHAPAGASSPRPFLGVHETEDTMEPVVAPSGTRTWMLVGIGAAAIAVVALGGYALVRPEPVGATATRSLAPPPSTAAADVATPMTAAPAAPVPAADTQKPPSTPRTPDVTPAAAAPESPAPTGTIQVVSPLSVNVSEGGRPLGSSGEPIRVTAGRHTLDIGREDLGYQSAQVVDVKPGRPLRIELSLPSGTANLNATPWAEVWIDGRKVGETPIGHLQLTIGPHEVQFRHPELGDQTRTLVVTTGSVALSVDLKK